jgi:hypothetical protein
MKSDWTSVSRPLRQALRLVAEGDNNLDYSSAEVLLDRGLAVSVTTSARESGAAKLTALHRQAVADMPRNSNGV